MEAGCQEHECGQDKQRYEMKGSAFHSGTLISYGHFVEARSFHTSTLIGFDPQTFGYSG